MTRLVPMSAAVLALAACAGSQPARTAGPTAGPPAGSTGTPATAQPAGSPETPAHAPTEQGSQEAHRFKENRTGAAGLDRGVKPSAIKPTRTEAALKFTVVDKDKGAIQGLVIKLTDAKGEELYTEETDAKGYTEVLVPVGRTYEVDYLSLGRKKIVAKLPVSDEPSQTVRLTLRYKRHEYPRVLVLEGVQFDSGRATLRAESYPRLDRVVEYMRYKKSARIEISGHTDNVGKPARNKDLSRRRAQACRQYLISKGIDGGRIEAVGYGAERPVGSNDTEEGRQQNRRIEAKEL